MKKSLVDDDVLIWVSQWCDLVYEACYDAEGTPRIFLRFADSLDRIFELLAEDCTDRVWIRRTLDLFRKASMRLAQIFTRARSNVILHRYVDNMVWPSSSGKLVSLLVTFENDVAPRTGMSQGLRLNEEQRELIYSGTLRRRSTRVTGNRKSWTRLFVLVLDNYCEHRRFRYPSLYFTYRLY